MNLYKTKKDPSWWVLIAGPYEKRKNAEDDKVWLKARGFKTVLIRKGQKPC